MLYHTGRPEAYPTENSNARHRAAAAATAGVRRPDACARPDAACQGPAAGDACRVADTPRGVAAIDVFGPRPDSREILRAGAAYPGHAQAAGLPCREAHIPEPAGRVGDG